jgi:mono/diheme cytochrome c family protein
MDYRGVLLVGILGGAALLGATTSCSGPDPGAVTFIERAKGPGVDTTSGSSSGTIATDGGASSGSPEGGSDGGSSSGVATTAFTGAPAFDPAGAAVGTSQNGAHPNGGNPAGVDCMSCHGAGGGASAKWGIAGTVYNSAAGTTPVAKANIRVVDAAGKELANVYSDALGNFWADSINGGLPGGAKVGARNATVTKLMGTALTTQDSGCQKAGCHVAGAQGRVYLQ